MLCCDMLCNVMISYRNHLPLFNEMTSSKCKLLSLSVTHWFAELQSWSMATAIANRRLQFSTKVYGSLCDQMIRRASTLEHGNGNCKPQAVMQYQSLWFFLWPIDPPSFNPGAWRWQLQTAGCNSHQSLWFIASPGSNFLSWLIAWLLAWLLAGF